MTPEDFAHLLQRHEGETLDFKREMPASADLARLITAFYNTRGGLIVLGVEDATRRPIGLKSATGVEHGVAHIVRDRCELDVMPAIEIVSHAGLEFVVVTCPRGPQRPYLVKGDTHPYVRVGSTVRQATHDEIREMYIANGDVGYDSRPARGATLADIDPARVEWYIARRVRGRSVSPSPLPELLGKLGAATTVEGETVPTLAGLLLFGRDPQLHLPQVTLRLARFLGTDMSVFLDQADLTGTLPEVIDEAERFIRRNTRHGIRIVGFRQVNVEEYPIAAVREAITNALCHRDYSIIGGQVRVAIFDERIFVDSPGRLPPGVTLENIDRVRILRNPTLAQLLYDVGYIEHWGSGVPRMRRLMQTHRLPPPVFEQPGPNFTVTLHGPGERFMREIEERPVWMRDLNERQIQAMLHVGERGHITPAKYREVAGISGSTATRDLRDLCKRDLLLAQGRGQSRRYVLARPDDGTVT